MKDLSKAATDEFKTNFHGGVVLPRDANYDEVREIWNAMIDRRPARYTHLDVETKRRALAHLRPLA